MFNWRYPMEMDSLLGFGKGPYTNHPSSLVSGSGTGGCRWGCSTAVGARHGSSREWHLVLCDCTITTIKNPTYSILSFLRCPSVARPSSEPSSTKLGRRVHPVLSVVPSNHLLPPPPPPVIRSRSVLEERMKRIGEDCNFQEGPE